MYTHIHVYMHVNCSAVIFSFFLFAHKFMPPVTFLGPPQRERKRERCACIHVQAKDGSVYNSSETKAYLYICMEREKVKERERID